MIRYIEAHSLSDILSYNTSFRRYFLTEAICSKDIMEALFNKMAISNANDVPFIFPNVDISNTIFNNCETWMIAHFLKFMIAKDSRGVLYNLIVYKNQKRLISLGIDLKSYFESSLVMYKIMDFPEYHSDDTQ